MSYNSDIPPPLPPSRPPKANQRLQRRPLPEIPKLNNNVRPLPELPTREQKSQQFHNDRRLSLPNKQHTPPVDGVKRNHSERHFSVDDQLSPVPTHVDSKQQNFSSPVPPKLPPRRESVKISPHLHKIDNDTHKPISPPVPPRLESQENLRLANGNTHEYETRFHFHPLDDLPNPEIFENTTKTYLSRTRNNRHKGIRQNLAKEELPAF